MARTNPATIMIKGDAWVTHEAVAAVILTPGEFVDFDSTGKFALPTAGQVLKMIVIESDLEGSEITDDYAADERVRAVVPQPGSVVRAILADGQSVAIGDPLELDANGELTDVSGNTVMAIAMEAVDASDSATTAQNSRRINVLIP